eukprot:753883-Hanusia_phi.AAC.4
MEQHTTGEEKQGEGGACENCLDLLEYERQPQAPPAVSSTVLLHGSVGGVLAVRTVLRAQGADHTIGQV